MTTSGLSTPRVRALGRSTLLRHGLLAALGVVLAVLATGMLSDFANYQVAHLGAVVCAGAGLTVLTGLNGQVSLGHAALMAVGGYTVALYLGRVADTRLPVTTDLVVALLLGTLTALAVGAVVGVAAARLTGPYLAGATLALGVSLPGITSYFADTFHGDQGLFVAFPGPPESIAGVSLQRWQALVALLCAVLVLLVLANLKRSAVGRHLAAVRDDEVAAQLAGLSVPRQKVLAFTVSAGAAGLGGAVWAVWLGTASPGAYDLLLSLALLAVVVIGGLGSLTGVVWGSLVVVFLSEVIGDVVDASGLSADAAARLHDNLPGAVYGLLLIVVMLAVPGGIHGQLRRLGAWLSSRTRHPSGGER